MKKHILFLFLFTALCSFGQTTISTVNSGALAQNDMIYSVGEVFVTPTINANEANSGLIGILSRIEFLVTGVDDVLLCEDMKIYPNPTSQSLFFEINSPKPVSEIIIYDTNGRLVSIRSLTTNSVNVSDLPDGLYFFKVDINSIQSFKFIKQ